MRHSHDAKVWQWFSLNKAYISRLHAIVAQRTIDADSLTAFAGEQIYVRSVSHRVAIQQRCCAFQQPACTLITRLSQYQQSDVRAQPHLLTAFLQTLLWHQLWQPLCSSLTGLPTACHPSSTRLITFCCCFCWCPLLRCF